MMGVGKNADISSRYYSKFDSTIFRVKYTGAAGIWDLGDKVCPWLFVDCLPIDFIRESIKNDQYGIVTSIESDFINSKYHIMFRT